MQMYTKNYIYANKILDYLDNSDGCVTVKLLMGLGIPRSFCVRILGILTKAGIVVSKEGRNGGYAMAKRSLVTKHKFDGLQVLFGDAVHQ